MSILDALRRGIDNFPGGRPVMALRLAKSEEVLRKELTGSQFHKLGARDALTLAVMCIEAGVANAYDYASAVSRECGGRFELGASEPGTEATLVQRVSLIVREASHITTGVIDAMADGVMSDNELKHLEREIDQAENELRRLRQSARETNRVGKPSHEAY